MLEHPLIKVRDEEPLPQRFVQRASLILADVDSKLQEDTRKPSEYFTISEKKTEQPEEKTKKEEEKKEKEEGREKQENNIKSLKKQIEESRLKSLKLVEQMKKKSLEKRQKE